MVDINYWFTVNVEATQVCVLVGDIDWDEYDGRLKNLSEHFLAIGADAGDGSLDRYSIAEVERVLTDANRLIREIGRKCGIPVN